MTDGGGWGPPPRKDQGPPSEGGGQQQPPQQPPSDQWRPAPPEPGQQGQWPQQGQPGQQGQWPQPAQPGQQGQWQQPADQQWQPQPTNQQNSWPQQRQAGGQGRPNRLALWLALGLIAVLLVVGGGTGIALVASHAGSNGAGAKGGGRQAGMPTAGGGDLLWQATLGAGNPAIPMGETWVTSSAYVYLGANRITAFNPTSGHRLWQVPMPSPSAGGGSGILCGVSSNAAQSLGVIVVGQGQTCTAVVAVDLTSGQVKWRTPIPSSLASMLDTGSPLQLAIVGSTVVMPNLDGVFLCNLADGGGSQLRGDNVVFPHTDLLADSSGSSALLAAWGVAGSSIVYSGTGDLQLWQIQPGGANVTIQLASKVPQASIPMGSNQDTVTIAILSASPTLLETSDLTSGGPSGDQIRRALFSVSGSGSVTPLPATTSNGQLDVDRGYALTTGSSLYTIAETFDTSGQPNSRSQVGYSTNGGRQLWANSVNLNAQTRPVGFQGQDVVFATGEQSTAGQGGKLTISSLNQQTGDADHQDTNFPARFVARAMALPIDISSQFAMQGPDIYGVSMLAGSGNGNGEVVVYVLR